MKTIFVESVSGGFKAASKLATKRLESCGFHKNRVFSSFALLKRDVASFGFNLSHKDKFKTKDNFPTLYAFICGHVEQKEHILPLTSIKVELYKEAGVNTWQIRGFRHYKGSSSSDRLFWHTEESLGAAKKKYQTELQNITEGVYDGNDAN